MLAWHCAGVQAEKSILCKAHEMAPYFAAPRQNTGSPPGPTTTCRCGSSELNQARPTCGLPPSPKLCLKNNKSCQCWVPPMPTAHACDNPILLGIPWAHAIPQGPWESHGNRWVDQSGVMWYWRVGSCHKHCRVSGHVGCV